MVVVKNDAYYAVANMNKGGVIKIYNNPNGKNDDRTLLPKAIASPATRGSWRNSTTAV
jgi:hypothetical protein